MAIYMLVLFVTAIITGLLFSRNTFCAYVCPVGHLLGFYARLAPMGWRVKDKSVCTHCKDKSCVSNKTAYEFQGRSCGVGLYPARLEDNAQCLLCGQCLKACDHNNPGLDTRPNPGWFPRQWFKDILSLKPFNAAQVAFCLVVSGFVIYEVFTEWSTTKEILLWIPTSIERTLGASAAWERGLVKSLALFVALPALLWLLPLGLFRLAGGRLPVANYLLRFGIAFIPIMAAAHAIKAILKMTSRIPYLQHAVSDPLGIETAHNIIDKSLQLSQLPVWFDAVVTALSLILMGVGVVLSLITIRKLIADHVPGSSPQNLLLYLIPALYGGGFFGMLIAWRLL
jgi:hypothetical protein